jgi:AcrR family transcriptional regulator
MSQPSPTPRTTRRQQTRAIETRTTLLECATTLFSAKGFDGVSVRHLEETAGVKRGLVAYHFNDKDQLWRAVVDRLFGSLTEDFVARLGNLADIAPLEAAKEMVRAFVRYSAAHPALNRIMMQESLDDSWRVSYLVDEHIRPMLDTLSASMPEVAGLVWGDGNPHRYYTFVGASAFVFSAEQECQHLFGVSPREENFVEHHAELVINLLLGDRTGPPQE